MAMYKVKDWTNLPYYKPLPDVTRVGWMFKDAFVRPHKYSIAQRIVDMLYRNGTILVESPINFIGSAAERMLVFE